MVAEERMWPIVRWLGLPHSFTTVVELLKLLYGRVRLLQLTLSLLELHLRLRDVVLGFNFAIRPS